LRVDVIRPRFSRKQTTQSRDAILGSLIVGTGSSGLCQVVEDLARDRDDSRQAGAGGSRRSASSCVTSPAVDEAEPSGGKLLAEALFERIDVLGARKVKLHPSASAQAQGWAEAWNGARLVVLIGARGVAPTLCG
jgi:hypothetical protein